MEPNISTLSAIDWRTIEQALQVAAGSYREMVQIHGGHMSAGPTALLREEAERCRRVLQQLAAAKNGSSSSARTGRVRARRENLVCNAIRRAH